MPIKLSWTNYEEGVRIRLNKGEVLEPVEGLAAVPQGVTGEALALFVEAARRKRYDVVRLVAGGEFEEAKKKCNYRDGVVYLGDG